MELKFNNIEETLFEAVQNAARALNYPVYLIGGYVRDHILQRNSKDIDIVCVGNGMLLAEKVATLLQPSPKVIVFKRFGTAMLKFKGLEVEFVGARKESYQSDSRKPSVEDGSLEDDQNRRDFTINALAFSLNKENYLELLDPFEGLTDLENKWIRTPLDPDITFSDDPLRMMRAIRFATQLNFEIDPATLDSITRQKDRIQIISQERITEELQKIMAAPKPSIGFELLFNVGLLEIIFPALHKMHGVEVIDGKAHKDNFYHTLKVLDNVSEKTDNIWLRWVAVLHDIAKPLTKKFIDGQGWTFHGHEALGAKYVPKFFRKMKLPLGPEMKYVQKLVAMHQRPVSLTNEGISDSAVRRLIFDAGEDIDDLITFCSADATSKFKWKLEKYSQNLAELAKRIQELEESDRLRNWQPPVDGKMIMETFGLSPCKEVGLIKDAIREAILDGIIPNDQEKALAYMMQIAQKMGLTSN